MREKSAFRGFRDSERLSRAMLIGLCDGKGMNISDFMPTATNINCELYRGADKSLARHNSRCILFDGENISFDASLIIYI